MSCNVALGEVAEFINGVAFKPVDWTGVGRKIVRIQNLNNDTKPYNRTERVVDKKYEINKGDILVSWSASLGVFIWEDEEQALLNQHIFKVVPNDSVVCRKYLLHALHKALDDMEQHLHGATMKHVNRGEFLSTKIYLPPLKVQKSIAAILDKADAIRRNRQQAINLTDKLLRSVFLDMFGDPVTNPNEWEAISLEKLCSEPLKNGSYYPKEAYTNDIGCGTRMIHMSDSFYGLARVETAKRVEISEDDIKKYGLQKTDLLVARRSLTLEGSAKPCRIPDLSEPLIYESSLIRIRPDLSKILPEYLYYYLSDIRARQKYLNKYITSATISGINQTNLAKVLVLVPELDKQKQFVDFLNRCELELENQKKSNLDIEKLVSSITQQAFNGELTKQTKAA